MRFHLAPPTPEWAPKDLRGLFHAIPVKLSFIEFRSVHRTRNAIFVGGIPRRTAALGCLPGAS